MENNLKQEQLTNGSQNSYPIYLLIVAGQTFSKEEKQTVLDRIHTGLVNIGDSLFAIKEELNNAIRSQVFESYNFEQENRIVYNETKLVVEILINSTVKSFKKALRQFFLSNLSSKYFINATVDLNTNGDINLQDSLFSQDDLVELLNDEQIKSSLISNKDNKTTIYLNSKLFELNKNWKAFEKTHKNIHFLSLSKPSAALNQDLKFSEFIVEMNKFLNETQLEQLMDSSKVIGTLRIQKPTLYIFPGREGDSAFFTINGYSMLVNGGYDRVKPCFWSFVSMLQQIDSVLITHTDSDALGGLSSFFSKKLVDSNVKPTVLTVLGNLIASKSSNEANGFGNSPKPNKNSTANLAANLIANDVNDSVNRKNASHVDIILESIERLKIKLMPLVKTNDNFMKSSNNLNSKYEHINLYYKLGQGSLDLYVLSPFVNSNEYKEFVQQQQNHVAKQTHQKSHLNVNQLFKNIPLSHLTSAVVLLVWLPAATRQASLGTENNALRLLFTGNAPQHVVMNALEKVKDFEVITSPVYRLKTTESHSNGSSNNNTKKSLNLAQNSASNNQNNTNGVKPASANHKDKVAVNLANTNGTNGETTTAANAPANTNTTKPNHNRISLNNGATNNKDNQAAKSEAKPNSASNNNTVTNKPPKSSNQTMGSTQPAAATANAASNGVKEQANKKEKIDNNKKKLSNGPAAPKEDEEKGSVEKKPNPPKSNGVAANNNATASASNKKESIEPKPVSATKTENNSTAASKSATSKPEPPAKKAPVKPVASKAAPITTVTQAKDQPTKKPLSIEVSNKKPTSSAKGASASADQAKKEPSVESRIITKRDPKPVPKPVESVSVAAETVVAAASIETTTTVVNGSDAVQTSSNIENNHVSNSVVTTSESAAVDDGEEIVTEQIINIELISSSNLENSNEVIRENSASENANLAEAEQVANYNEWPNLSPVKKDQNGASAGGDYLDENGNNSMDDGLQNGALKPTELNFQGNLLSDPSEMIVSPKDQNNLFAENGDVMTRSFIDDGSNANPFATGTAPTPSRKQILDDSENDLNKTHELTDEETSEFKTDENGHQSEKTDLLIEGIQSLSIESKLASCLLDNNTHDGVESNGHGESNGHVESNGHTESNGHANSNPAEWNLLQLPKPINPNDLPAAPASTSVINDKKLTPNGKKNESN